MTGPSIELAMTGTPTICLRSRHENGDTHDLNMQSGLPRVTDPSIELAIHNERDTHNLFAINDRATHNLFAVTP